MTNLSRRYQPNGTPLTAKERELITHLAGQANSIARHATTMLSFGKDNIDPLDGSNITQTLGSSIGALNTLLEIALRDKVLFPGDLEFGMALMPETLARYTQHLP